MAFVTQCYSLDESLPKKRLTLVERARLEAFQSFGGSGLDDVLGTSRKIVAITLKGKENKTNEQTVTSTGDAET